MAIFEIQHILSWINMKNFASTILSFSRLLLNTVRETWTARGSIGKNKANIYNSGTKCRYSVTRGGSTTLHQKLPILNGDSGSFDFHVIEIVLPFSFFFFRRISDRIASMQLTQRAMRQCDETWSDHCSIFSI